MGCESEATFGARMVGRADRASRVDGLSCSFFFNAGGRCSMFGGVREFSVDEIKDAVRRALEEDIGSGDATTLAIVPENQMARAAVVAREECVVAGIALAETAFAELSPAI